MFRVYAGKYDDTWQVTKVTTKIHRMAVIITNVTKPAGIVLRKKTNILRSMF